MERVVVTGIGAVTPVGNNVDEFWNSIKSGKHGFGKITAFDTEGFKAHIAGEVKNFNPEEYIDKKEARRMDRYCQFAMAAAVQAVKDSGIDFDKSDRTRAGVIVGSGIGGLYTFETEHTKLIEKGCGRVSPLFIPMMISNMAAGHISMQFNLNGTCYCPVSACATGSHAIGEAFRNIKHGYLDIAVCGGSEATITPMAVAGFSNMTALSTSENPDEASLPFDKRRNGFVMGEGGGIIVLESLSHAKARGARIYAEISGYGSTADAYHITSPDPEGKGAANAMLMAVNEAGMKPTDIDYINAHGTATPVNDKYETLAIKKAFGEHAKKLAISSTKSMTGHLLGAAGAVEAIVCVLAIKEGIIPPTINLTVPDEDCDLDYVPGKARKADIKTAISNSLGFGGHNASLLVKKYTD